MKKRIKLLLLITFMLVFTVGCSIQNKFLKSIIPLRNSNYIEYDLNVDEINLSENIGSIPSNIVNNIMTNANIKGNLYGDSKDKSLIKTDMKLNLFKENIPFEIINKSSDIYISLDYISAISNSIGSTFGMNFSNEDTENNLKDKYLKVTTKKTNSSKKKKDENSTKTKEDIKKYNKKVVKILISNIKNMDKKQFSVDEKTYTVNFKNEDLKKITNEILELNNKNSNIYKISNYINKLEDIKLKVAINSNDKKCKINFDIENKGQILKATTDMKLLEKDITVKMPKKENIITKSQLNNIMKNSNNSNNIDEDIINSGSGKLTDEEFNYLVQEILSAKQKGIISVEDINQAIKEYSKIYNFTDEQMNILKSFN